MAPLFQKYPEIGYFVVLYVSLGWEVGLAASQLEDINGIMRMFCVKLFELLLARLGSMVLLDSLSLR